MYQFVPFALALLSLTAPFSRQHTTEQIGGSQEQRESFDSGPPEAPPGHNSEQQISPFVRRIFEDSHGNLWLGTNGDGVVRYNGDTLEYFSLAEGFSGVAVRGIDEDRDGNVWFGTEGGVTRFDGASFSNYTMADGLSDDDVWSLLIDRNGSLWVGTYNGACSFDPASQRFVPFPLPAAKEIDGDSRGVASPTMVRCIAQGRSGNLWFATDGGAYRFDGASVVSFSERDGLADNSLNHILEDRTGTVWFATHFGGVSRYDGSSFTNDTKDSTIHGDEVWSLFEDSKGNIWFPAENYGVYRFDGTSFTNFGQEDGLASNAIQCIYEDRSGRIWLGGWLGLFRFDGQRFFQVTTEGPWE